MSEWTNSLIGITNNNLAGWFQNGIWHYERNHVSTEVHIQIPTDLRCFMIMTDHGECMAVTSRRKAGMWFHTVQEE